MINKNSQKGNQKELEYLLLSGRCPYCFSKQVKYHEFSANLKFGFNCLDCKWKSQYEFADFLEVSRYWTKFKRY